MTPATLGSLLFLVGFLCVFIGTFLISPPVAIMLSGAGAMLAGLAIYVNGRAVEPNSDNDGAA